MRFAAVSDFPWGTLWRLFRIGQTPAKRIIVTTGGSAMFLPAHKMYEALGFIKLGERPPLPGEAFSGNRWDYHLPLDDQE